MLPTVGRVSDHVGSGWPGGVRPAASRFTGRLLDLAFPARCSGCGAEGSAVCERCRPGLLARVEAPGGVLLGLPGDVPSPLIQLEWCAPFEGVVRSALHDLKYAGERRLGPILGDALAQRWRRVGAGGDLLVPVPIHRDRERQRGYDQAALLAAAAAARLGLPFDACLERHRSTVAQFQLDRDHRATNVAGAFRVRIGCEPRVAGRWIVLIDDVATTGATLAACAQRAARRGGPGGVGAHGGTRALAPARGSAPTDQPRPLAYAFPPFGPRAGVRDRGIIEAKDGPRIHAGRFVSGDGAASPTVR